MYIHYFLKTVHESYKAKKQRSSLYAKFLSYWFDEPAKPFYYNIAGHNFTLEDIKHGLLRKNRRKPFKLFPHLKSNDSRILLLTKVRDNTPVK